MVSEQQNAIELFYSYAQEDEHLRAELEKALSQLKRRHQLTTWHSQNILPGKDREQEIDTHLRNAQVILLLVSPDFLASDYCYSIEMQRAIERHNAGTACVIPILLRPTDWQEAPFAHLQSLPTNGKPVIRWSNRDEAWLDIAQGISQAVEEFNAKLDRKNVNVEEVRYVEMEEQQQHQLTTPIAEGQSNATSDRCLERPATVFLSYRREDADAVRHLQRQLKVRGVRAWRDVTNLPLGGTTEDEIVQAIEQQADAFVLYVTPGCLASRFIWDVEVPTALQRRERDKVFHIIPILRGVTFAELQQQCAKRGLYSLTRFNGENITNEADEELHIALGSIARRILKSALSRRLQRIGIGRNYEPWISLNTFQTKPPTPPHLDLDLDWWDLFQDRARLPTEEEWHHTLFPALQDVKHALADSPISRNLHISLNAVIPVGFAIGFTFPASAGFTLLPENKNGTWSTAGTPKLSEPLKPLTYDGDYSSRTIVVELAIAQSTAHAVTDTLSRLSLTYRQHIRFTFNEGPDYHDGVRDAAHALAISHQIGKALRKLCNEGISHFHLFAALPVALSVMIGHQFNALCPVTVYYYNSSDSTYKPVCTLQSQ